MAFYFIPSLPGFRPVCVNAPSLVVFWCLTQAVNGQDATFKLPLGFFCQCPGQEPKNNTSGPKKTPCCADPVRMGQP